MTKSKEKILIEGTMEKKLVEPVVTLKELFERLVQVETKLDMKTVNDEIVAKRFKSFTFIIILVEVVNFVFNYLILRGLLNILERI